MTVTPVAGNASSIVTGGTAVTAVLANPAGINGGIITNPLSPTDQNLATAEALYVNIVNVATVSGYGTTFALQPGQSFSLIPGQTTAVSVNANSSGHRFSVIQW